MVVSSLQRIEGLGARIALVAVMLALLAPGVAAAQDEVPRIGDAERLFEEALAQFEEGDYVSAHQSFERVHTAFPLNRRTTASMIMDAKALYRSGAYEQAQERIETFLSRYPTSGYVDEAERLAELIDMVMEQEHEEVEPIRLGVAMGLEGDEAVETQEMFNGIRLAVEEDNEEIDLRQLATEMEEAGVIESGSVAFLTDTEESSRPVQMVFEDIGDSPDSVRAATERLIEGEVDVIIGPLFSDDAMEAAEVAEQHGVPFIAPMATDERVSEGRDAVFQANPTLPVRGRQMARFAVEELELSTIGIAVGEGNELSERMAESFQEEVLRLGGDVPFYQLVPGEEGWQEWPELAEYDSLAAALEEEETPLDAVYLPITGGDSPRVIRMALNALDRHDSDIQVLGNAEWHDLSDASPLARHRTVYTNDFSVDEDSRPARTFIYRYETLTGNEPDRLGYVGYDVTRYLLGLLNAHEGEPLAETIRRSEVFDGLSMRFDFQNGNVNEALFFHRYRYGRIELLD